MECKGLPEVLYKFSCSSSKSFIDREIFFNDPNEFNDPFDMKIRRKVELLPKEDFILQNTFRLNKENHNQSFQALWDIAQKDYEEKIASNSNYYIDMSRNAQFLENKLNKKRVLCLSEKNDDILMWAHYGNSNKGICIGYNTKKLCAFLHEKYASLNLSILRVQYSDQYPEIVPTIGTSLENILKRLIVKSNMWSCEKEWRLIIHNQTSIAIQIPNEIVEEIILGSCVSEDTE